MNYKGVKSFLIIFVIALLQTSFAQANVNLVTTKINKNKIKIKAGEEFNAVLTAEIENGFHINSHTPKDEFLIPLTISSGSDSFKLVKVNFPQPEELQLPSSEKPVSSYTGKIKIDLTIKASNNLKKGKYTLPITINYQGCNDKNCFAPESVVNNINIIISEAISSNKTSKINSADNTLAKNKKETKVKKTVIKKDSVESKQVSKVIKSADDMATAVVAPTSNNKNGFKAEDISVFAALLFAFAGGIILNLMPCVLPVLSIKIMGFVQQAGEDKSKTKKHGFAFTLGVLVSFWILAAILIALRAGGEYLGWGFQLQSPGFIIVISILLFLFGLSMFGVFEIGTSLTSADQNIKSTGYFGSFISGVLATIVATPCTAPFMGSALGFALSQPVYLSLLVFTFLGLGMALPYVLLTNIPKLLRFVPKPGAWMESLKQFMGFLLMATVLWLMWVLSLQTGSKGVLFLLTSFIIASLGGWIYGRWGNISKKFKVRKTAQILSLVIIISSLAFSLDNIQAKTETTNNIQKQGKISWENFSHEKIQNALKEGRPVFVDFTAAWCLSCQVNERVAFSSKKVQDAFADNNIMALKGDWTNNDPVITKALEEFGRNSVPLYVLYKPGKEPVLLPEIITPEIVLDHLKDISN